ncbi:FHA domain-containing protein [Mesobacillus maritimus]|uniref:FHA domain-containing protein n=1 Tax=Mesobacillus maritimus TaxID=1643336 RepID=UPI00203CD5EE|nr:FHA domain-containing protein [Mesobacillus maritimus]MCM3585266.1 FHA domain-containing protein [Mesobacillus maritimus]
MLNNLELQTENYGISTFLFYEVPDGKELDRAELEAISERKFACLLPWAVLKKEETVYLRYEQISDIHLGRLTAQSLTQKEFRDFLTRLLQSLLDIQNSGLHFKHLLLDPKYIFLDHFSKRLVFIYIPIKDHVFKKGSLKQFLQSWFASIQFDETEDGRFYVKLHNYLASVEEVEVEALQEKLREWQGSQLFENESSSATETKEDDASAHFYRPGSVMSETATSIENGILTSEYTSKKKDKKTSRKLEIEEEVQYKRITRTELDNGDSLLKGATSLGGTSINIAPNLGPTDIAEEEGTTVLGANQNLEEEGTTTLGVQGASLNRPFLLCQSTKEKITLSKAVFKIGRDPSQADYATQNKVVGRVHAELLTIDGEYFLIDKQSRNGSYLNGVKLIPNEKFKIKHEDVIKLANEEFMFKVF